MAKRFTDTEKWKKPFLRNLKAEYKILWFYILDECDHAGIWQVDLQVAEIKTGCKFKEADAKKYLCDKIQVFSNGEKWFIPDFIEFQYGELNEKNRVHYSVILQLKKYNLLDDSNKIKPLTSILLDAKDKDMDKEQEQDMDFKNKKDAENLDFAQIMKSDLDIAYDAFVEMRKKMKGGVTDHALNLIRKELMTLSQGDEVTMISILNQSTMNSWKGVFPLKNQNQFQQATPVSKSQQVSDALAQAKENLKILYPNG